MSKKATQKNMLKAYEYLKRNDFFKSVDFYLSLELTTGGRITKSVLYSDEKIVAEYYQNYHVAYGDVVNLHITPIVRMPDVTIK